MPPRRHWLDLPELSPAGGLSFFSPAYPAFGLRSCPLSPQPPSPTGKGENFSLFCRGLRPRHPCLKPFAALTISAMRAPRARAPAVRCRTGGSPFLRAVPAAKERGDRGRGTSAFEMVLSPGAGRASAAGVQPPCGHHSGKVSRQPAGQAPPKNHSSASSSRKAVTKPRAAASSDASAKIRRRGSVPENRQITKELSAK